MAEMGSPDHHPVVYGGRGQLHELLASSSTRLAGGLPLDFAQLKDDGCRSLRIAGHDVLEVCFQRNGNEFHLYVARGADFPGNEALGTPMFREQSRLASVSWHDRSHAYVLVTDGGADSLRQVF
jgi:hypothetical protein